MCARTKTLFKERVKESEKTGDRSSRNREGADVYDCYKMDAEMANQSEYFIKSRTKSNSTKIFSHRLKCIYMFTRKLILRVSVGQA